MKAVGTCAFRHSRESGYDGKSQVSESPGGIKSAEQVSYPTQSQPLTTPPSALTGWPAQPDAPARSMATWLVRTGIRPVAWILGLGAVLACLAAWVGSVVFTNHRIDAYLAQEHFYALSDAQVISANLNLRLGQARSVIQTLSLDQAIVSALERFGPDIEPSTVPQPERGARWMADPSLYAISQRMTRTVQHFGLNSLWLSNAAGDAVAEGHAAGLAAFIGTNYADRDYFKSAQSGQPGRQFAIGRATNVYGLFLSAPIQLDGRFMGMVGVNLSVPSLGRAIEGVNAVVTDDLGVIVLASDSSLLMQTGPGSTVYTLSPEARNKRYKRTRFDAADIDILQVDASHALFRLRTLSRPYVMASYATDDGALRVHILRYLGEPLSNYRRDQLWWFGLVCLLVLSTALLLGGTAQYLITTQTQQNQLIQLNHALAHEADTDTLTGCANRRHFLRTLEQEKDRAERYNFDLCVLSLDIDHFKRVNDLWGHAAGDAVLKHSVATIQGQLRQTDLLGRMGGEEFSILLPHTSAAGAAQNAERIRAAVQAAPALAEGTRIDITVSIGGTQWTPGSHLAIDALLAQADQALYAAKHAGRNRVAWTTQGLSCY